MKKGFSNKWIGSRQVRKQRKYRVRAPLHIAHRFMSVMLSKELKKKYGRNSFPLRKGDRVMIMRGRFRKREGKIERVYLKRRKASIEGVQITKKDGTKINCFFEPSNLQIKELNLEDKERIAALERTGNTDKKDKGKKEEKQKKIEEKKQGKEREKGGGECT